MHIQVSYENHRTEDKDWNWVILVNSGTGTELNGGIITDMDTDTGEDPL